MSTALVVPFIHSFLYETHSPFTFDDVSKNSNFHFQKGDPTTSSDKESSFKEFPRNNSHSVPTLEMVTQPARESQASCDLKNEGLQSLSLSELNLEKRTSQHQVIPKPFSRVFYRTKRIPTSQLAANNLVERLSSETSFDKLPYENIAEAVDELIRESKGNLSKLYDLVESHVAPALSKDTDKAKLLDATLLNQLKHIQQELLSETALRCELKLKLKQLMQFNRPGDVREKGRFLLAQLKQYKNPKPIQINLEQLVRTLKSDNNNVFPQMGFVISKDGLKTLKEDKCERSSASYTGRKMLGKGSFGRVYSALKYTDRVAIKVMEDSDCDFSKAIKEGVIGLYLQSPLVVTIHKVIVAENATIIMDVADGSFETLIARNDFVKFSDLLTLMRDVVDALALLDSKGIRHGDIKPANFVFVKNEEGSFHAKLIDFGNASFIKNREGHMQDVKNAADVFECLLNNFKGTIPQKVAFHFYKLQSLAKQGKSLDKLRLTIDEAEMAWFLERK